MATNIAWPRCNSPVTLGGGMEMTNGLRAGSICGRKKPLDSHLSYKRPSTSRKSYTLGSENADIAHLVEPTRRTNRKGPFIHEDERATLPRYHPDSPCAYAPAHLPPRQTSGLRCNGLTRAVLLPLRARFLRQTSWATFGGLCCGGTQPMAIPSLSPPAHP